MLLHKILKCVILWITHALTGRECELLWKPEQKDIGYVVWLTINLWSRISCFSLFYWGSSDDPSQLWLPRLCILFLLDYVLALETESAQVVAVALKLSEILVVTPTKKQVFPLGICSSTSAEARVILWTENTNSQVGPCKCCYPILCLLPSLCFFF